MEEIIELLFNILDLIFIGSSSKNRKTAKVDGIFKDWAKKLGLHPLFNYRDDNVRTVCIMDDGGNTYQIWIDTVKFGKFKVNATNNKSKKERKIWSKKCRTSNLTKVLYEAYGVTEQWITKSGNSRKSYT